MIFYLTTTRYYINNPGAIVRAVSAQAENNIDPGGAELEDQLGFKLYSPGRQLL